MQYRSPNAMLDHTGYIVNRFDSGHRLDKIGIRTFSRCDFTPFNRSVVVGHPIMLLIYAD